MALSLKADHLKRYKDIALLLYKYSRPDLVKSAEWEELVGSPAPVHHNGTGAGEPAAESPAAVTLAEDLERLGPTFIKVGQILSTRPDLLPPAYIQALAKLQDNVAPFPFDQVEAIVSAELGTRISKAFAHFEAEPIAAASLGQVHRATLRDGRLVAVKVQRPGAREQILTDIDIMTELAEFLEKHTAYLRRYHVKDMLAEFRRTILQELDYRQEARNLALLRENMREFRRIVVPRAIDSYTTTRVLTMEYVHGVKVTALTPLAKIEVDGRRIAEQLFRAYLKQILADGFFHADPHPGNIFITGDGKHVALLDLGMVARISPPLQEKLLQLLLAISEGHADDAASLALRIGRPGEEFDEPAFRQHVRALVEATQRANIETIAVGRLMMEVARASADCGVELPPELTMLGKTLLSLDAVARTLDPEFDPNEFIRRNSVRLLQLRMTRSASTGSVIAGLLETKDFFQRLPKRINQILDLAAENNLSIKVDAIDEDHLIAGLEKIANRITLGLVLAALIVGAAMLMNVHTSFTIMGYPGIAMVFFLAAAAGGIALVINILVRDG